MDEMQNATISIHALRVEGDQDKNKIFFKNFYFYPRPPGGGRRNTVKNSILAQDFYPRPPGGGRLLKTPCSQLSSPISIHALRVEGDGIVCVWLEMWHIYFYPRPPGGGRPKAFPLNYPRAINFYPRPPGGGRRAEPATRASCSDFYPRPPGGGRQQKRTKFSSVFAQKGEEIASLRRGKRKFAGGVLKRTNFGF